MPNVNSANPATPPSRADYKQEEDQKAAALDALRSSQQKNPAIQVLPARTKSMITSNIPTSATQQQLDAAEAAAAKTFYDTLLGTDQQRLTDSQPVSDEQQFTAWCHASCVSVTRIEPMQQNTRAILHLTYAQEAPSEAVLRYIKKTLSPALLFVTRRERATALPDTSDTASD